MKQLLFFLLTLVVMVSCSPQKRLDRLLDKNPELLISQSDTIYHTEVFYENDTFYLPPSNIFEYFDLEGIEILEKKEFVLEDELIKTIVTLSPPIFPFAEPTLDVETEFKGKQIIQYDTTKIKVPTYINRDIILKEYRTKWYDWLIRGIFILGIIYLIGTYFVRFVKWVGSLFSRQ